MSKVKIIGHRGAANHTENTIPSFESAIAQGVDGIELDVRASSDGILAVVHASVVGEHAVKSTPYATFKSLPDGYEVPLFEDVLKKFGKKTQLDIELKHDGIEEEAVALIKRYCNPEKTVVSGFNVDSLSKVHELLPQLQPSGAVPAFDADALATTAVALLADPPALPASIPYTLQAMEDATLAVYAELLDRPRG